MAGVFLRQRRLTTQRMMGAQSYLGWQEGQVTNNLIDRRDELAGCVEREVSHRVHAHPGHRCVGGLGGHWQSVRRGSKS